MNKEVSAYLDAARLLGALLVLCGHVELNWVPGAGHFFVAIGNESLAVLFVLSGYVIGFVSDRRETTFKSYLIHRTARAYSLLIPCVIFGFFLDAAGKHFLPSYYLHGSWPQLGSDFQELKKALFSFTFLGEAWGGDFFPGSMAPYWTMPYEWTYYLLFGTLWYLRGWRRVLVLLVIGAIAGPEVLLLFPLWLIGTATYWLAKTLTLSVRTGRRIFFGGILAGLIIQSVIIFFHLNFGFGGQESPYLWPFFVTGILFSAVTIGFRFAEISIHRYMGWVQWAAGASGTLYLLHFPLGRLLNGLIPFTWPVPVRWCLLVAAVIAISFAFARLAERRREAWRRKIEAGWNYLEGLLQSRKAVTPS